MKIVLAIKTKSDKIKGMKRKSWEQAKNVSSPHGSTILLSEKVKGGKPPARLGQTNSPLHYLNCYVDEFIWR